MNRRTPHWQADVPHTASNMNAVTNRLWILAPGCTNTRWRWNIPTDSWAGMMQNLWCFSFLFVQQEDVETCRHVMTANCYVFHCNCCKFKRTTRRRWNIPLRQWTLAINDFGPTRPVMHPWMAAWYWTSDILDSLPACSVSQCRCGLVLLLCKQPAINA